MTTPSLPESLRIKLTTRPEGSFAFYADGAGKRVFDGVIRLGAGVVCEDPFGLPIYEVGVPLCGEGMTTNNHAELAAIDWALQAAKKLFLRGGESVHILSDSSYALGAVLGVYALSANVDQAKRIQRRLAGLRNWHKSVTFGHVRGHRGHPFNERADFLAGVARDADVKHEWSPYPNLNLWAAYLRAVNGSQSAVQVIQSFKRCFVPLFGTSYPGQQLGVQRTGRGYLLAVRLLGGPADSGAGRWSAPTPVSVTGMPWMHSDASPPAMSLSVLHQTVGPGAMLLSIRVDPDLLGLNCALFSTFGHDARNAPELPQIQAVMLGLHAGVLSAWEGFEDARQVLAAITPDAAQTTC